MLRLKDVRTEENPELLRVAIELYEKDRTLLEEQQRHRQVEEAAQEIGLPLHYLARAAATVQDQRAARMRRVGFLKGGVLFTLGTATGLALSLVAGLWAPAAPPPVAPAAYAAPVVTIPSGGAGSYTIGYLDGNVWIRDQSYIYGWSSDR